MTDSLARSPSVRAVVQRVSAATVRVAGSDVASIGPGLLVLLGVGRDDDGPAADLMARRLHELRILPGSTSCADSGPPLLVVSQFTLYGDTSKGRRPSWSRAAPGERARPLVDRVVQQLRLRGAVVETGTFGAHMVVDSSNDGPVTVIVET